MNIISLCSIEKTQFNSYRVRYLRDNTFKHEDFDTLLEAVTYAQEQLQADRDEILLAINK